MTCAAVDWAHVSTSRRITNTTEPYARSLILLPRVYDSKIFWPSHRFTCPSTTWGSLNETSSKPIENIPKALDNIRKHTHSNHFFPTMVQILNLVLAALRFFRQAPLLCQIERKLTHVQAPRPLSTSRPSKELLGLHSHYQLPDH